MSEIDPFLLIGCVVALAVCFIGLGKPKPEPKQIKRRDPLLYTMATSSGTSAIIGDKYSIEQLRKLMKTVEEKECLTRPRPFFSSIYDIPVIQLTSLERGEVRQ